MPSGNGLSFLAIIRVRANETFVPGFLPPVEGLLFTALLSPHSPIHSLFMPLGHQSPLGDRGGEWMIPFIHPVSDSVPGEWGEGWLGRG